MMQASEQMDHSALVLTDCVTLSQGINDPVDVVTSNGVITAVEPSGTVSIPDGTRRVSANGLVALPGLSNSHTHTPMVLMRGAAEDVPVHEWFNNYIWPMEVNLTAERVRIGARLACAEMLLGGVTGFADHYFHADQIAEAAVELGIRADIAPTFFTSGTGHQRDSAFEQALEISALGNRRITASLGPHSPYTVEDDDLRRTSEFASDHGLRTHIHAAEDMRQTRSSVAKHGKTPIQILEETGILRAGALIAHGGGITESDLDVLGQHNDRVSVATCPKVYFKHDTDPMTPIRGLLAAGVTVGTGTDGAAGHNTLDSWEAMRLTALAQKLQEHDPTWLPADQALNLATAGAAKACGFADSHFGIEVGARADLTLIDAAGPHCQPMHNLAATLVYAVRASDVRTVIVDGDIVVHNGELLTADINEILDDAQRVAPELIRRQSGQRVQDYAP